jgi:hypothetical protein
LLFVLLFREHSTLMSAVFADGSVFRQYWVFKGSRIPTDKLQALLGPDAVLRKSESGWMDAAMYNEW